MTFNVATNDSPADADPLALNQYANGKVPSPSDTDYFKVTDPSIKPGDLVFAYVDTSDTDGKNVDARDSYLKVLGSDGTTVLGEDDDDGPAVSDSSFDKFNKDLKSLGVDLSKLGNIGGGLSVSLGDGNDTCNASKINLLGSSISINGGPGNDTILLPGGDNLVATGDDGNDTFVVNPTYSATGTIDGGTGNNTVEFDDPGGSDDVAVTLNGDDLTITAGNVTSDFRVTNIQNLSFNGGNRLGVEDAGPGDCMIWRQGRRRP